MTKQQYCRGAVLVLATCLSLGCERREPSDQQTSEVLGDRSATAEGQAPSVATEPAHCPDYQPGVKRVFWGDFHVHTAYSFDAYAMGTRAPPEDAYCFARGPTSATADAPPCGTLGRTLERGLDFAATTDHAEFFGLMYTCTDPLYKRSPVCAIYRTAAALLQRLFGEGDEEGGWSFAAWLDAADAEATQQRLGRQPAKSMWARIRDAANAAYEPCKFTTFVGNEWSDSFGDDGTTANLHRNIIYANDRVPELAIDSLTFPTSPQMWEALEAQCTPALGCEAIAIPHNANASRGLMWQIGDEVQARLRAKYERLVEIHQIKGNSECLDPIVADDAIDDCGFEMVSTTPSADNPPGAYVRSALGQGLKYYAETTGEKINPLTMGFIGSLDTHNGTPGDVEEDRYRGAHGEVDDTATERLTAGGEGSPLAGKFDLTAYNPGGLVAVWAEENTRESIFAALKRRETYATSGPRITVRFYQTWDGGDACAGAGPAPGDTVMGGQVVPASGVPQFVTLAAMDRRHLARVDLIKISYVDDGQGGKTTKEELFSHWASDRANGDPTICRAFADPSYDPAVPALWYARVVEVPSPRWSHYDCQADPAACALTPEQNTIQERAWASPIWNLP